VQQLALHKKLSEFRVETKEHKGAEKIASSMRIYIRAISRGSDRYFCPAFLLDVQGLDLYVLFVYAKWQKKQTKSL
jgi:hypothetical protein